MNSFALPEERQKLEPVYRRIKALLAHGLKATDLTWCWVGWHIQPLSVRAHLFHQYTSRCVNDMRYSSKELEPTKVVKAVKKILGELLHEIETMGLAPF